MSTPLMPPLFLRRSKDRGFTDLGWLKSFHSFSFGDYYSEEWMQFGPLRVINDDWVAPGGGFPTHPHRDMEIITCMLAGSLRHQDSMGNSHVIHAGQFQYMAAGSGIRHSEFNDSRSEPCHLLQIWIEPNKRGLSPRYADASFVEASGPAWHLVATPTGRHGSFAIHQDAEIWWANLGQGQSAEHILQSNRRAWIHVATGSVSIDGNQLGAGDAIAFAGAGLLRCTTETAAQILLFDLA
jgi:redox-sensitive bicupin YhaK (pirin superfamily)